MRAVSKISYGRQTGILLLGLRSLPVWPEIHKKRGEGPIAILFNAKGREGSKRQMESGRKMASSASWQLQSCAARPGERRRGRSLHRSKKNRPTIPYRRLKNFLSMSAAASRESALLVDGRGGSLPGSFF